jgi:hypothetical protein
MTTFGALLQTGDLMTAKADVSGTSYAANQIVVTSVISDDVIKIGVILAIVLRMDKLLFIVAVHDAVRSRFRFFEACPCDTVDIVDSSELADFKPLYMRDRSVCFRFFLHHHLPTPIS